MSNFKKDVKEYYGKNKELIFLSGISIAVSMLAGVMGHVSVKLIDKVIK